MAEFVGKIFILLEIYMINNSVKKMTSLHGLMLISDVSSMMQTFIHLQLKVYSHYLLYFFS